MWSSDEESRVSHPEQVGYFRAVAAANSSLIAGARLLEVGSYDVNGTVRQIFAGTGDYVGVDLTEGPGVDRVCFGHEVDDADGSFDLTISGECFEHDENWPKTFANMVRLTRPGGLVVFTCASRGRPEHGTTRSDVSLSPGTQAVGSDYYRNLTEADFSDNPLDEWFSDYRFFYLPTSFDLYFAGVRAGHAGDKVEGRLPAPASVEALRKIMPLPHRLVRAPLRFLSKTRVSEEKYQDVILRYWQFLLRASGERGRR
jgi:SAM-dependent methyltransferase